MTCAWPEPNCESEEKYRDASSAATMASSTARDCDHRRASSMAGSQRARWATVIPMMTLGSTRQFV
jgi:hypothetical protein